MRQSTLVIAAMFVASVASADGTDHEHAVTTFEEARKLIDDGNCDAGLVKLEQSLRYEPSIGARLSMADCLESRDPLEAWNHLREAERLAYLKQDERRKVARERAIGLETRLAIVRVTIDPTTLQERGFELRVDGALIDRFFYGEGTLAMKPGPHTIEASAPNKRWSQQVVARPAATTSLTVQLAEPAPAPPPPVRAPVVESTSTGNTQRRIAFVVGGTGALSLIAGAAFGIVAISKRGDIETACGGNITTCHAAPGALDGQRAGQEVFAHLSTAGFIVGGVLIATGVALYVFAPRAQSAPRIGIAAGLGSVRLEGSF